MATSSHEPTRKPSVPRDCAAWQLAQRLGQATLIAPGADWKFRDPTGREIPLNDFATLWYHQGDSSELTGPIYEPGCIESLRKYSAEGHGLLLSGAALAMVHPLGLEAVQPRRAGPGADKYFAQIMPVEVKHPAFHGLASTAVLDEIALPIPITDAGYPAFSDFHGVAAPTRGKLLARAVSAQENPLVEYELGKGRVIVLGWRLPHYAHATNAHRANLERLTANLLGYLAEPKKWQKIVLAAAAPSPTEPGIPDCEWRALELAIRDLTNIFGTGYPQGEAFLQQLTTLHREHAARADAKADPAKRADLDRVAQQFRRLRNQALLENPLLKFDRLLVIERGAGNLGLPANWESNSSLSTTGSTTGCASCRRSGPTATLTTLYQPPAGRFVGDVDLHFDADRLLFSMPGANGRWQVHEMHARTARGRAARTAADPRAGRGQLRRLLPARRPHPLHLDGPVRRRALRLRRLPRDQHCTCADHDGSIRQLTVDQEHNWCPTVLNNGRVLYLRWEYTDLPHSNSRRLFHMNPDGTGADGVPEQQLVLPQLVLLRPADSGPSDARSSASPPGTTATPGRAGC